MRRKPEETKERRTLETCFVCNGKIAGIPVRIGQDKSRHVRCQPGGARWMQSQRATESSLTEFFISAGEAKHE